MGRDAVRDRIGRGTTIEPAFPHHSMNVGVSNPERIRVLDVPCLPMPDDPLLKQAAIAAGFLGPDMIGLTLRYAVLVRTGHGQDVRLLSHEFRHVYQYEQASPIAMFLSVYLEQIVTTSYRDAPLEVDACAHKWQA